MKSLSLWDHAVHICVPPGVAVSTPNKELFWHPNLLFLLLPHLLPVENPQIATQHFKNAPTPSEKPSAGPARGFPARKKRGGGPIMVINTSRGAEGIRVWACSAAYVDPAASVGGWFSSSAACRSVIPLTEQRCSSGSHKLFKNGSSMFCRKKCVIWKEGWCLPFSPKEEPGWACRMVKGSKVELRLFIPDLLVCLQTHSCINRRLHTA